MLALGEAPPTAGLPPRLGDLLAAPAEDFAVAAARFMGAPAITLVSSGTAALRVVFSTLKRLSGRREVIVPAYTCPLVVLAAAAEGLVSIPCDLEDGSFELDRDCLSRLIGPDTLCVVPTHYFGALTDVARVKALVGDADPQVRIVEDAAQAFGARWHGNAAGLAGDIGVLSFGVGKGVTLFEGGGLVTRDEQLAAGLKSTLAALSRPSRRAEWAASAMLAGYHMLYSPIGLALVHGRPRRRALGKGDDIAAAGDDLDGPVEVRPVGAWRRRVAASALSRLPAHLARSRSVFDRVADRISAIRDVTAHLPQAGVHPTCLSMFLTLPRAAVERGLLTELWKSRQGAGKMFARAIGDYPFLASFLRPIPTPRAADLAARTITLTTSELLNGAPWGAIEMLAGSLRPR